MDIYMRLDSPCEDGALVTAPPKADRQQQRGHQTPSKAPKPPRRREEAGGGRRRGASSRDGWVFPPHGLVCFMPACASSCHFHSTSFCHIRALGLFDVERNHQAGELHRTLLDELKDRMVSVHLASIHHQPLHRVVRVDPRTRVPILPIVRRGLDAAVPEHSRVLVPDGPSGKLCGHFLGSVHQCVPERKDHLRVSRPNEVIILELRRRRAQLHPFTRPRRNRGTCKGGRAGNSARGDAPRRLRGGRGAKARLAAGLGRSQEGSHHRPRRAWAQGGAWCPPCRRRLAS